MSYDLFFTASTARPFGLGDALRFFEQRANYEVDGEEAHYLNQDTGVYFHFSTTDLNEDVNAEDDASEISGVSFNMNFYRPRPFALEAEIELAAFIAEFNPDIFDPQTDGMGNGPYTRDGFLRSWGHGNDWASAAIKQTDGLRPFTLPGSQLESIWRWNYTRASRQPEFEYLGFVPCIFFVELDGRLQTVAVWGDGIPILLPKVDLILAPRHDLAPGERDIVLFHWSEVRPIVQSVARAEGEFEAYPLFWDETPSSVVRQIRDKSPVAAMPTRVEFGSVLDQELFG